VRIRTRWGKTGIVDVLPRDLADSLAAAYEARRNIHFDICTEYTAEPGFGCTCGVPRLLEQLVEELGLPVAVPAGAA
jgi:hypothetical protein